MHFCSCRFVIVQPCVSNKEATCIEAVALHTLFFVSKNTCGYMWPMISGVKKSPYKESLLMSCKISQKSGPNYRYSIYALAKMLPSINSLKNDFLGRKLTCLHWAEVATELINLFSLVCLGALPMAVAHQKRGGGAWPPPVTVKAQEDICILFPFPLSNALPPQVSKPDDTPGA